MVDIENLEISFKVKQIFYERKNKKVKENKEGRGVDNRMHWVINALVNLEFIIFKNLINIIVTIGVTNKNGLRCHCRIK